MMDNGYPKAVDPNPLFKYFISYVYILTGRHLRKNRQHFPLTPQECVYRRLVGVEEIPTDFS